MMMHIPLTVENWSCDNFFQIKMCLQDAWVILVQLEAKLWFLFFYEVAVF